MINLAMQRKLSTGECLDVLIMGKEIQPGLYELDSFVDDVDYCDSEKELWIWSIGKDLTTGRILASTGVEYYMNPEYECLWLR